MRDPDLKLAIYDKHEKTCNLGKSKSYEKDANRLLFGSTLIGERECSYWLSKTGSVKILFPVAEKCSTLQWIIFLILINGRL